MKRFSLIFFLFAIVSANAQNNGYYVNNNGIISYGEILYSGDPTILQQEMDVEDSLGNIQKFYPGEIKEFAFTYNSTTIKYESVNYNGTELFLQLANGGKYLQEYIYYTYYNPNPTRYEIGTQWNLLYYKNGILFTKQKRENAKKYMARYFEEDPLLSNMALNKAFNLNGKDGYLIFPEYDKWVDSLQANHLSDTTMTLRGILDANTYCRKSARKKMWNTILLERIFPLGLIYAKKILKTPTDTTVIIPNAELAKNQDYKNAYEARAATLNDKSVTKGVFLGIL
jgi:hypothetical protein